MYSFSYLEPICCSMSSSNCCFLTCIYISEEAGQVVWYSISFRIFHFIVIHTVKGFGIVNKAEIDIFLDLSCFFNDPVDVGNLSLVPLPFLKEAWTSGIPLELFQMLKDEAVNLENSAVATGLEKVSFHSNPKERQCQRMLKLLHNCTHLTC